MILYLAEEILYRIGSALCHQLSSRTLVLGKKYLPVCARDTGIYIGMFVALMFMFLRGRWRSDRPPRIPITLVLCLFILIMGLDGITSYLHIRDTNNGIRLITGGFFGMAIPFLLMPIAHYKVYLPNKNASLDSFQELGILSVVLIIICGGIYYNWIDNWWLVSIIIIMTILFIHHRVCYTLVIQILKKGRMYTVIVSLILQIFLLFCMYFFSKYMAIFINTF